MIYKENFSPFCFIVLGSPKEEHTRPKGMKDYQVIITSASRRSEHKMASVGQSKGAG